MAKFPSWRFAPSATNCSGHPARFAPQHCPALTKDQGMLR